MRLLTMENVRKILGGRSRSSIYRDVAEGRIPAPIKLGGRLYWPDEDIEAALQEMKAASDGE